jgi:hypothetical protein
LFYQAFLSLIFLPQERKTWGRGYFKIANHCPGAYKWGLPNTVVVAVEKEQGAVDHLLPSLYYREAKC